MTRRSVFSLAFKALAVVCSFFALIAATSALRFVRDADRVPGIVADLLVERNAIPLVDQDESSGLLRYPLIEYEWTDGLTRSFTGRSGRASSPYAIGERVMVRVLSSDPDQARIDSVMEIWGAVIILGGLALGFLVIGLLAPLGYGGSITAGRGR